MEWEWQGHWHSISMFSKNPLPQRAPYINLPGAFPAIDVTTFKQAVMAESWVLESCHHLKNSMRIFGTIPYMFYRAFAEFTKGKFLETIQDFRRWLFLGNLLFEAWPFTKGWGSLFSKRWIWIMLMHDVVTFDDVFFWTVVEYGNFPNWCKHFVSLIIFRLVTICNFHT